MATQGNIEQYSATRRNPHCIGMAQRRALHHLCGLPQSIAVFV